MQVTMKNAEVKLRSFPMLDVLSITTGRVLNRETGFAGIHELMDHLFPGIGPVGIRVMVPVAVEHILKTAPFLADLPEMEEGGHAEWLKKEMPRLPSTLALEGPLVVAPEKRDAMYGSFLRKAGLDGG